MEKIDMMETENNYSTTNDSHCLLSKLWNNFLVNLAIYPENNKEESIMDLCSTFSGDEEQQQRKNNIQLKIYDLKHINIAGSGRSNNNRFRKSWGNFVNLYDDNGKQKLFIKLHQLNNYLTLKNFNDSKSPFVLYASLFTNENFPMPLYSGPKTSWRMRYNIFIYGLIQRIDSSKDKYDNDDDDEILHIGELHLYFHVEQPKISYQNLCFFYDQSLNEIVMNSNYEELKRPLTECMQYLRSELSNALFVEQFFFPIVRERFKKANQTLDYFILRQQDLDAAINISNYKANEGGLESFLYQPQKFKP